MADLGPRGDGFEYMPHVAQTTWAGLSADIRAGAENLLRHDEGRVTSLFTVGFCFGGRLAFLSPTLKLELAGAIGFYGLPVGPYRNDIPAPIDVVHEFDSPVLGLFGGADRAIPTDAIAAFEGALSEAGVDHRIVTYDDAPHSFFDRKAADYADASARAWEETLTFVRGHVPDAVAR